jgi:hypothetical protein
VKSGSTVSEFRGWLGRLLFSLEVGPEVEVEVEVESEGAHRKRGEEGKRSMQLDRIDAFQPSHARRHTRDEPQYGMTRKLIYAQRVLELEHITAQYRELRGPCLAENCILPFGPATSNP